MNYKETRDSNNQLHSFNDEPAIIHSDGSKSWFKNGKLHRDNDEPTYISAYGNTAWYIEGVRLSEKQIELLKKINASEVQHLPWLLNEDQLLNSVIEKRLNEET